MPAEPPVTGGEPVEEGGEEAASVTAEQEAALAAKRADDLMYAAKTGDVAAIEALIAEGGATLTATRDDGGWSALTWAASEARADAVAALLKHGAAEHEIEPVLPGEKERKRNTPLHWAAYKGHTSIAWSLLTHGLSPSVPDSEGNTALHLAAAGGHLLLVKTMLSAGIDVAGKNDYGNTPLKLATDGPCRRVLKDATEAAKEGRRFLCACTGLFVGEGDSVAASVVDRVSQPSVRPVRYSKEAAAKIGGCEEELQAAIHSADTASLEAAISAGEDVGASAPLLDEATYALQRLRAQIALQAAVAEVDAQRPNAKKKPLLGPLKTARARGVEAAQLERAERLCQTVEAEATLLDTTANSAAFAMDDEGGEALEPPPGDGPFAVKVDRGIERLGKDIAEAQSFEAMGEVLEKAQVSAPRTAARRHTRPNDPAPHRTSPPSPLLPRAGAPPQARRRVRPAEGVARAEGGGERGDARSDRGGVQQVRQEQERDDRGEGDQEGARVDRDQRRQEARQGSARQV